MKCFLNLLSVYEIFTSSSVLLTVRMGVLVPNWLISVFSHFISLFVRFY